MIFLEASTRSDAFAYGATMSESGSTEDAGVGVIPGGIDMIVTLMLCGVKHKIVVARV